VRRSDAIATAVAIASTTFREHLLKHHLVQRVQSLLQRLHANWPCLRLVCKSRVRRSDAIATAVATAVASTTFREHLLKHHLVQRVQSLLQRLHADRPCLRLVCKSRVRRSDAIATAVATAVASTVAKTPTNALHPQWLCPFELRKERGQEALLLANWRPRHQKLQGQSLSMRWCSCNTAKVRQRHAMHG
jgi:hypothetical protein